MARPLKQPSQRSSIITRSSQHNFTHKEILKHLFHAFSSFFSSSPPGCSCYYQFSSTEQRRDSSNLKLGRYHALSRKVEKWTGGKDWGPVMSNFVWKNYCKNHGHIQQRVPRNDLGNEVPVLGCFFLGWCWRVISNFETSPLHPKPCRFCWGWEFLHQAETPYTNSVEDKKPRKNRSLGPCFCAV